MIPKIIHHIWIGKKPFSDKFNQYKDSWHKQHPGWVFHFWTDDNLPEMPEEIADIVQEEKYLVSIRSDILRLYVLSVYGGVYSDTDIQCLKPFDEFLRFDFFTGYESDNFLCNALIGCTKNNPVTNTLLSQCVKNINEYTIELANVNSLAVSATIPLTDLISKINLVENNVRIFEPNYFYPIPPHDPKALVDLKNSFAVHYWAGQDCDGWASQATQQEVKLAGIKSLYETILARPADEAGLNHYATSHLTVSEIEAVFYSSKEYKDLNNSNFYNNSGLVDLDFLEIGTSDYDALIQSCSSASIGMSVEPVKYYLDRLPNRANVKKFNMAISVNESIDPIKVYYITPDVIDLLQLPDWVRGCNSVGQLHFQHKELNLEKYVKVDLVPQVPIDQFLIQQNIRGIKYLKIDTEGGDCFILNRLLGYLKNKVKEYYPKTIMFESNALTEDDVLASTLELYCNNGYMIESSGHETIIKLK